MAVEEVDYCYAVNCESRGAGRFRDGTLLTHQHTPNLTGMRGGDWAGGQVRLRIEVIRVSVLDQIASGALKVPQGWSRLEALSARFVAAKQRSASSDEQAFIGEFSVPFLSPSPPAPPLCRAPNPFLSPPLSRFGARHSELRSALLPALAADAILRRQQPSPRGACTRRRGRGPEPVAVGRSRVLGRSQAQRWWWWHAAASGEVLPRERFASPTTHPVAPAAVAEQRTDA